MYLFTGYLIEARPQFRVYVSYEGISVGFPPSTGSAVDLAAIRSDECFAIGRKGLCRGIHYRGHRLLLVSLRVLRQRSRRW